MKYLIILLLSALYCSCISERSEKPNFVIIYTDDQQYKGLGINGNPIVLTPNIDRMAEGALQFTNANVAFSLCSPSRAALLTGRYGSANGVLGLGSALKDGEVTLASIMQDAGYTTALSGKWHIQQHPETLGFDHTSFFLSNGTYYGRMVIQEGDTLYPAVHVDQYGVQYSMDFIEQCAQKQEPFLLFHCPQTPHMNGQLIWDVKESTKQRYDVHQMPVPLSRLDSLNGKPELLKQVRNLTKAREYGYPDSLAIQTHTRDYYSVITELDGFLGDLFDKIEKIGVADNTYIIFMSDNGWMLGDHGFTSKVLPYRPSTHVPFWISGPNIKATISDALVSNLDIMPTVLELAGVELPQNLHGLSLKQIIEDENEEIRDHFIYEGLGSYGNSPYNLTLITKQYRYIVTWNDQGMNEVAYRELYDQKEDPNEIENLLLESGYSMMTDEFDGHIAAFKNEVLNR